jgi:hypothetical protein
MQSDCKIGDCPITNDADNQPGELWGTSISFAEPSEITQEGRIAQFKQWETYGVDIIRADLQRGGTRYVGGPPAVQALALEWVRSKETQTPPTSQQPKELLTLKPGMFGINIDLKELWRRLMALGKSGWRR